LANLGGCAASRLQELAAGFRALLPQGFSAAGDGSAAPAFMLDSAADMSGLRAEVSPPREQAGGRGAGSPGLSTPSPSNLSGSGHAVTPLLLAPGSGRAFAPLSGGSSGGSALLGLRAATAARNVLTGGTAGLLSHGAMPSKASAQLSAAAKPRMASAGASAEQGPGGEGVWAQGDGAEGLAAALAAEVGPGGVPPAVEEPHGVPAVIPTALEPHRQALPAAVAAPGLAAHDASPIATPLSGAHAPVAAAAPPARTHAAAVGAAAVSSPGPGGGGGSGGIHVSGSSGSRSSPSTAFSRFESESDLATALDSPRTAARNERLARLEAAADADAAALAALVAEAEARGPGGEQGTHGSQGQPGSQGQAGEGLGSVMEAERRGVRGMSVAPYAAVASPAPAWGRSATADLSSARSLGLSAVLPDPPGQTFLIMERVPRAWSPVAQSMLGEGGSQAASGLGCVAGGDGCAAGAAPRLPVPPLQPCCAGGPRCRLCDLGTLQAALERGLFAEPQAPACEVQPSGGPAAAANAATAAAALAAAWTPGGRLSPVPLHSGSLGDAGPGAGQREGGAAAGGPGSARRVNLRALLATALEVAGAMAYLHDVVGPGPSACAVGLRWPATAWDAVRGARGCGWRGRHAGASALSCPAATFRCRGWYMATSLRATCERGGLQGSPLAMQTTTCSRMQAHKVSYAKVLPSHVPLSPTLLQHDRLTVRTAGHCASRDCARSSRGGAPEPRARPPARHQPGSQHGGERQQRAPGLCAQRGRRGGGRPAGQRWQWQRRQRPARRHRRRRRGCWPHVCGRAAR
jgi:hypothetical protein